MPSSATADATRMPTTLPASSSTGPPELPGLAGAWVWNTGIPVSVFLMAVSGPSVMVGWTWESADMPEEKVEAAG